MSLLRLPVAACLLLVLGTACSVDDTPTGPVAASPAASVPAGGTVLSPAPPSRGPEAQDACTQLALTRLDGLLAGEPSASPEDSVRANEVVAEFVEAYDEVLVAQGVDAARASVAKAVGEACKIPAGQGNVVQVPVEEGSPTG